MDKLQKYICFIQEAEQLKSVLRTSWTSSGRQESTAEHTWRLTLLASLFLEEYPEFDSRKVLDMCLIHDMGELYGGDISAILNPDPKEKYQEEAEAVNRAFSLLPEYQKAKFLGLWEEYNANETGEARLVKALDKAETIIQHNQGKNPEDFNYQFNLTYGSEYFQYDPMLKELRKLIDDGTKNHIEGGA